MMRPSESALRTTWRALPILPSLLARPALAHAGWAARRTLRRARVVLVDRRALARGSPGGGDAEALARPCRDARGLSRGPRP